MSIWNITSKTRRFARKEDGVALVEFAIFLPLFLLAFAVIVEFARIFFSYQAAVVGVRDAARYLARTTQSNICFNQTSDDSMPLLSVTGVGTNASPDQTYQIVKGTMINEEGFLPTKVFLISTSSTYFCRGVEGDYRQDRVPVAEVETIVDVQLPLGNVFNLNGITIPTIRATIRDQSRIFGV